MRMVTADDLDDRKALVKLDPDHPGFKDPSIAPVVTRLLKSR